MDTVQQKQKDRERVRAYYKRNRLIILEKRKRWRIDNPQLAREEDYKKNHSKKRKAKRLTRKHKMRCLEYQRKYRAANPKIKRSRDVIYRAKKFGHVGNEPCQICKRFGKAGIGKIEAHHCDYNKPAEVMWLCVLHHKAWHKVFIPEGREGAP